MTRLAARLRAVGRGRGGFTLVELITVMAILLVVLTAITSLFVSGTRAEIDMNRNFQAQQQTRVAVDRMRRDIHCADSLVLTNAASVTVTLAALCPTAAGTPQTITWDTQLVSTGRYLVRRAGVQIADYATTGDIFSYVAPSASTLGKLHVDIPVDLTPSDAKGLWRLQADIVLRNTARS